MTFGEFADKGFFSLYMIEIGWSIPSTIPVDTQHIQDREVAEDRFVMNASVFYKVKARLRLSVWCCRTPSTFPFSFF